MQAIKIVEIVKKDDEFKSLRIHNYLQLSKNKRQKCFFKPIFQDGLLITILDT